MNCDRCDFTSENDFDFTSVGGELLCEECFLEEYFVCDICGEICDKAEASGENGVCKDCVDY